MNVEASLTRRMILPLLFGIVGVAVLMNLGFWQVRRLAWKNDIVAEIEARMEAAPVAVPQDPDPDRDRYLQVAARGVIGPGEVHVYTSVPSRGVGYRIIVPLTLEDRRTVLLDRGFVPIGEKDAARLTGPVRVEGALDWPRETDGYTGAPDTENNIWLARDVDMMAEALDTEPVLIVTTASDDPGQPMPMPVSVNIRNDHLGYAITWFGLAAVWMVMTATLLWRIKRRTN